VALCRLLGGSGKRRTPVRKVGGKSKRLCGAILLLLLLLLFTNVTMLRSLVLLIVAFLFVSEAVLVENNFQSVPIPVLFWSGSEYL
jgi:hypothetical protein